ncbi:hypothetical protein NPIL_312541 [Nephila pilipes]|uniref:Uncharacterized protein n=1 Tax=Nephila pilipes TaxID=299642 RepID=A0A8X6TLC0_NEPPI|nr:hypothetical protein NPIL_312541 [Nephila pilipes]
MAVPIAAKSLREADGRCFDAAVRGTPETSAPVSTRYFDLEALSERYNRVITFATDCLPVSHLIAALVFRQEGTWLCALRSTWFETPMIPTMFLITGVPAG